MSANSTSSPSIHIAIDLGASSGRVISGALQGGEIILEEIHRFENFPIDIPSGLYWDTFALFHEIQTGLRKAVKKYPSNIVSVGIDTWACDFALLDANQEIIAHPHQYRDPRTNGMADLMHEEISQAEIYAETGIKTNFYNTALHLFSLSRQNPALLKNAATILFIPDLMAFWLTGIVSTELTNASTSQLIDPHTRKWSAKTIDRLGLPSAIFRKLTAPGTAIGPLRPEILGNEYSEKVQFITAPAHDTASAVAGIPLSAAEPLWLSSGTWSIMGVEAEAPITNDAALALGFCNELGIDGTTRILKNIAGLWLIQESKRSWQSRGENFSYEELASLADAAPPFRAFIDPDHESFSSPGNMPQKIQEFCSDTSQWVPQSVGEISRVVTDSLALKYRSVFEDIKKLTGRSYARLHAGGGGIQNSALCQATANALGIPVYAGPVEATSCGNLSCQMIASGTINSSTEAREIIVQTFPPQVYTPHDSAAWEAAYARFLQLIRVS